jgi:hypothetical protein
MKRKKLRKVLAAQAAEAEMRTNRISILLAKIGEVAHLRSDHEEKVILSSVDVKQHVIQRIESGVSLLRISEN